MVKDKDHNAVLELLPKNAFYYFTNAHIERALPCEELLKKANQFNLKGNHYSNVTDALDAAKAKANNNDIIIVFGSVFLIAEVNY